MKDIDYWKLKDLDIVDWLKPLLDNGMYLCRRSDGRFEMRAATESYTTPWHHINYAIGGMCPWLQQVCLTVSPRTPAGQFVPRRCHACWKIVIKPRTLTELFKVEEMLEHFNWPSKCGIERRSYTPPPEKGGRYGGYIYNMSNEEGLERLDLVREYLKEHDMEGVEAYLKRACTEFEMSMGPSHNWKITDKQHEIENILDWMVISDTPVAKQAQHIVDKVHMEWIEWACGNGDTTYLEYTGGKPIYAPAVRYERKADETDGASLASKTVGDGSTPSAVPKGATRRTTKKKVKK